MSPHLYAVHQKGTKFWQEFKEFALKGSVIDLAVGVIIGTALGAISNSLVKDIILPPLGLLLKNVNFSNLFISLSGTDYPTLEAAQAAGAPTLNYGLFLNQVINFLIMTVVVFVMVKQFNRIRRAEAVEPAEKECLFCRLAIPVAATRCPHCTSELR